MANTTNEERETAIYQNMAHVGTWNDILGYEGLYQVSSDGQVRSLDRTVTRTERNGIICQPVAGRILKLQASGKLRTYLFAHMNKAGISKQTTVHILVAEAFIGPRPEGCDVHHIDGNSLNNIATNLRYVERKAHKSLHWSGENNTKARLTELDVRFVRIFLRHGSKPSVIARRFGVSKSAIKHIKKGRNWK